MINSMGRATAGEQKHSRPERQARTRTQGRLPQPPPISVTGTTGALALLLLLPWQAAAQEDCAALHQVVAMTATGFAAVRGEATKFTGRGVWRSRVTLPHTGACIVDPQG